MDNITRAPRAQPAQITPTKNDNQFAALALSDSEAESNEDTKSYIEEEYLPNHPVNEHTPHNKGNVKVIENLNKITTSSSEDKSLTDD